MQALYLAITALSSFAYAKTFDGIPLMADVHMNNGQASCTSAAGNTTPLDPAWVQQNFNIYPTNFQGLTYAGSCIRPQGDYWAKAKAVKISQIGWSVVFAAAGWVVDENLHLCWRTWQVSEDNKNWSPCTAQQG